MVLLQECGGPCICFYFVSGAKTKEVKNKVSGGGRIDVAGNQKAASEMMDLMMPKGFKTGKKNDEEGKPTKEKKAKKEQARADMFRLIFFTHACMYYQQMYDNYLPLLSTRIDSRSKPPRTPALSSNPKLRRI